MSIALTPQNVSREYLKLGLCFSSYLAAGILVANEVSFDHKCIFAAIGSTSYLLTNKILHRCTSEQDSVCKVCRVFVSYLISMLCTVGYIGPTNDIDMGKYFSWIGVAIPFWVASEYIVRKIEMCLLEAVRNPGPDLERALIDPSEQTGMGIGIINQDGPNLEEGMGESRFFEHEQEGQPDYVQVPVG